MTRVPRNAKTFTLATAIYGVDQCDTLATAITAQLFQAHYASANYEKKKKNALRIIQSKI